MVPDFRKANYEGLRRHLEGISWNPLEREGEMRGRKRVKGGQIRFLHEGSQ